MSAYKPLQDSKLLEMYETMVLSRILDERIWMLNRQGKAAIVASSQGHEAAQIGSVYALRTGEDQFYIYYRDLAVMLSLGMTPLEIMLGFTAKEGEPLSGARQFPTHGSYGEIGLVNLSNVIATQLPQAVGVGLAMKMQNRQSLVITYFGDGASSAGDTHEAMNFASVHKLPVIFLCENNKYAISVPLRLQMAVDNVADRAQGYGMPGVTVDGTDIVAVYEAVTQAAERARNGSGPTLIEAVVERYLPHTSDDDDSIYRSHEEIENAKKHDPIIKLRTLLLNMDILDDDLERKLYSRATSIVNEATDNADKASYAPRENFYGHVYKGDK